MQGLYEGYVGLYIGFRVAQKLKSFLEASWKKTYIMLRSVLASPYFCKLQYYKNGSSHKAQGQDPVVGGGLLRS